MIVQIYSIYDSVSQSFVTPFYMHNDGLAIRAFSDNVNDSQGGNLFKHSEQFTLFHLGEFDDSDASILLNDAGPKAIALGVEVKEPEKVVQFTNDEIDQIKRFMQEKAQ